MTSLSRWGDVGGVCVSITIQEGNRGKAGSSLVNRVEVDPIWIWDEPLLCFE